MDAAFAGGSLSTTRDAGLIAALHAWRNQVVRFNSQLALAEMLAFTVESESVLRDLRDGLHGEAGPLARLRSSIEDLLRTLEALGHADRDSPRTSRVVRARSPHLHQGIGARPACVIPA